MYTTGISKVQYNITIHFPTKGQVALTPATEVTGPNILTSANLDYSMSASTANPIGVISANTLSLEIDSLDLSLDPTNTNSIYYGEMNSNAYAIVQLFDDESEDPIQMGKFFVSNWKPNITDQTPHSIHIDFVDLMSTISKMKVPMISPPYGVTVPQYLALVFDALNDINIENYQIQYRQEDLVFGPFTSFNYEQLDTSTMGNMLNTLAQCTITNMTIDALGYFKVDYLLDDSGKQTVMEIINGNYTYSASLSPTTWIPYDDVKVIYIPRNLITGQQVASKSQIPIKPGDNKISGLQFGDPLYALDYISVSYDQVPEAQIYISEMSYDKSQMDLVLTYPGINETLAKVEVYGTVVSSDTMEYNSVSTGALLEVKNPIIVENNLPLFVTAMRLFLTNKAKTINLTGIYNPRLQLGDIIYITLGGALSVDGYYKVTKFTLSITSSGLSYSLTLDPMIAGG